MNDRIYLIESGCSRKFIELQDEDFVRLIIETKRGDQWSEIHSTPISKQAVLAAAKLLNIPLVGEQAGEGE